MANEITLVLGGARSGKSEVAEKLALGLLKPVTYVATGGPFGDDPEWAQRVRRHRERRPAGWTTVETSPAPGLGAVLRSISGAVLVDSLGTWVAALPKFGADGQEAIALRDGLVARRDGGDASIVVSEEVGLGVHPSTTAGRLFRDALGSVNRLIAEAADSVLLVVAGRVLTLGDQL